jgi:hypothetical protein
MSTNSPTRRSTRLGVEQLEVRDVPSAVFSDSGGLSVAFGDVITTRGTEEYVTGTGPGRPGLVRVWDDSGALLYSFRPFGNFSGGIYVAVGNVVRPNASVNPIFPDPQEIVVSTGPGTSGRVKVYSFTGGSLQEVADFLPFGPNYNGGVQLALGNVTGDNSIESVRKDEIVVGQQRGGSNVKVYSIDNSTPVIQVFQLRSFNAYAPSYRGGVTVGVGNIHPTPNVPTDPYSYEYDEIVTGRASGLPHVKIFDAQTSTVTTLASYMAYDISIPANRVGINVYAFATDGIRGCEIYVNPVGTARVTILDGWTSSYRGEFVVAVPPRTRGIYLATGRPTDPLLAEDGIRDVIAVFTVGPYEQIPIIFPGALNSPAGLNGSYPAG